MSFTLVTLFAFSITIAAVIGCIRFSRINPAYYPFLYFIWLGFLNEILSFTLVKFGYTTSLNNNIYVLAESFLIAWQFKNWGIFGKNRLWFIITLSLFFVAWSIENVFIGSILKVTFYFRILYSFIIVLFSVNIINGIIIRERKNIIKNPVFLICMGFVIYFTFKVLVQTSWLYGINMSKEFANKVVVIIESINLFANLIYALAILWMPTKHRFTLPS